MYLGRCAWADVPEGGEALSVERGQAEQEAEPKCGACRRRDGRLESRDRRDLQARGLGPRCYKLWINPGICDYVCLEARRGVPRAGAGAEPCASARPVPPLFPVKSLLVLGLGALSPTQLFAVPSSLYLYASPSRISLTVTLPPGWLPLGLVASLSGCPHLPPPLPLR